MQEGAGGCCGHVDSFGAVLICSALLCCAAQVLKDLKHPLSEVAAVAAVAAVEAVAAVDPSVEAVAAVDPSVAAVEAVIPSVAAVAAVDPSVAAESAEAAVPVVEDLAGDRARLDEMEAAMERRGDDVMICRMVLDRAKQVFVEMETAEREWPAVVAEARDASARVVRLDTDQNERMAKRRCVRTAAVRADAEAAEAAVERAEAAARAAVAESICST